MKQSTSANSLDHLLALQNETRRFAEVLSDVDPGVRVPSCPDWEVADLIWHLAEVQWFWAEVVGRPLRTGAEVEALARPDRPADLTALREFQRASGERLQVVLRDTEPSTPCWSLAPDQTAGFSRRRQAHEALIHRVDAELAAGDRSPIDATLAADGVDELLTVMYGADQPVPEDARTVAVQASDTSDRWRVRIGGPEIGLEVRRGDQASAEAAFSGSASDLDCWLWNRPPEHPVAECGSAAARAAFTEVLARGVH